jgi:signal transduction histidine kinase
MRVSLKTKLTALISLLVLLVVLATSVLYISSLIRQVLSGVQSRGEYFANEVYNQARSVLMGAHLPPGTDPRDFNSVSSFVKGKMASDQSLAFLLESIVGYSRDVNYVTITDTQAHIVVHDDPSRIGELMEAVPDFSSLQSASLFRQLQVIFGPPRKYEFAIPLRVLDQPLGEIRVGVSTVFLADEVRHVVARPILVSVVVILLATLSAGLLSFRLLRPLETISLEVERLSRGEYARSPGLDRSDEWGVLSSRLSLLGERIRGEKAAFDALKENLDQLFSKLADGLLLFDSQERLVLATPAVSHFLGRSPEEIVYRPAAELFTGDDELQSLLRQAFQTRRSVADRVVNLPRSATPRVSVSVQFVLEGEQTVAALVTLRDASTRAQLESQLDLAARLTALGRLTSGVAHEVKNPLNAMVLQVEIIKAKLGAQADAVKPQLDVLSSEIRRLDRVVRTFLDFTRPVEVRPTETDVESLISEVFTLAEPHARQRNVRLVFERNGTLPPLRVDRDLIKQALLNLVLNGCQAMPTGGELTVRPHLVPHGLQLEIADQGVGIPPEARDKIFSLYYTTKPNGTGVGLAMAYRIIQLHNGSIDFSSEVNRGTTFRVVLPC